MEAPLRPLAVETQKWPPTWAEVKEKLTRPATIVALAITAIQLGTIAFSLPAVGSYWTTFNAVRALRGASLGLGFTAAFFILTQSPDIDKNQDNDATRMHRRGLEYFKKIYSLPVEQFLKTTLLVIGIITPLYALTASNGFAGLAITFAVALASRRCDKASQKQGLVDLMTLYNAFYTPLFTNCTAAGLKAGLIFFGTFAMVRGTD